MSNWKKQNETRHQIWIDEELYQRLLKMKVRNETVGSFIQHLFNRYMEDKKIEHEVKIRETKLLMEELKKERIESMKRIKENNEVNENE